MDAQHDWNLFGLLRPLPVGFIDVDNGITVPLPTIPDNSRKRSSD
ncbi:hypothetical protein BNJ_00115 [Kaumoebavirus]|nr:hypothetical protein BNJ_00115 [Kaumoebavirus]ARA71950.1 hypothetical protein BNJ_00115 [Kaumoebavirus]